jgi:DNA-binding LytR/AlgR family response regulator
MRRGMGMRELKIAVCDDEEYELKQISRMLSRAAEAFGCAATVFSYRDSRSILNEIENGSMHFDLLCLDLYIDEKIGFDIAAAVRRKGYPCAIIFITAFADRMAESFRYVTSAYLIKPVDETKMKEAFGTALSHLNAAPSFLLHRKEDERSIPFRQIIYLESRLKQIYLYCQGEREPIVFPEKLAEISRVFPKEYFHFCHKSYLVNFHYVQKIDKVRHEAVLADGSRLPVSRNCYAQILKDFMQFHSVAREEQAP